MSDWAVIIVMFLLCATSISLARAEHPVPTPKVTVISQPLVRPECLR